MLARDQGNKKMTTTTTSMMWLLARLSFVIFHYIFSDILNERNLTYLKSYTIISYKNLLERELALSIINCMHVTSQGCNTERAKDWRTVCRDSCGTKWRQGILLANTGKAGKRRKSSSKHYILSGKYLGDKCYYAIFPFLKTRNKVISSACSVLIPAMTKTEKMSWWI